MALGGADAPHFGVGGRGAAGSSGGCAEETRGVGFDLVALFVVGCDYGLEFGEVDFEGGDAAPEELDGLVSWDFSK